MRRYAFAILVFLAGAIPASAQVLELTFLTQVDLSSTSNSANPEFIGSNPSAVAWNGSSAWVAGYNASGGAANTAIVRISNVLTTPAFGTAFGVQTTNNLRGFTSLAIQGNTLASSWDNGSGNVNSVRAFNTTTEAQLWATGGSTPDNTRRGNGVAFDPGFNGAGSNQGVAYLAIGSGRRHLLNTSTGDYINGQNAGAIMNFTPTSTTWRDLDFDPATGDLYTRESNRVGRAVRNGDNSFIGASSTVISAYTTATAIDNQNLAVIPIDGLLYIIANDRSSTSSGQNYLTVIRASDQFGAPRTISYVGLPGSFPTTGNGAYDFSYHAASQTLAISDFANRQLYIFSVASVPEPATWALAGAAGIATLWALRRRQLQSLLQPRGK